MKFMRYNHDYPENKADFTVEDLKKFLRKYSVKVEVSTPVEPSHKLLEIEFSHSEEFTKILIIEHEETGERDAYWIFRKNLSKKLEDLIMLDDVTVTVQISAPEGELEIDITTHEDAVKFLENIVEV